MGILKYIFIFLIGATLVSCNSEENKYEEKIKNLAEQKSINSIHFNSQPARPPRNQWNNESEQAIKYWLYHRLSNKIDWTIRNCNFIILNETNLKELFKELKSEIDTIQESIQKVYDFQTSFATTNYDNYKDTFYEYDYLTYLNKELEATKVKTDIHYTKLILSLILNEIKTTLSKPESFFYIDVNLIEPLIIEKANSFECYMNILDTIRENKIIITDTIENINDTIFFNKTVATIPKEKIENSNIYLRLETSYGIYSSKELYLNEKK